MSQENCIFCDKSQFEERLIGETKGFWVIATLGQIIQGGYVLLVSKRHVPCIGAMEEIEIEELCQVKQRVYDRLGYLNEASPLTIFEHGIVGQSINHAHLHIAPIESYFSDLITNRYSECTLTKLPVLQKSWQEIRKAYLHKRQPYLLWKDGSIGIKVLWNPKNVPSQYLRTLMFNSIGQPELANWRKVNPESDKNRWSETVRYLRKYFEQKR